MPLVNITLCNETQGACRRYVAQLAVARPLVASRLPAKAGTASQRYRKALLS